MSAAIFLILRIILALTLYTFLILVAVTIWRDLKKTSDLLKARKAPAIQLTPLDGDNKTSQEFTIPVITIGRDPHCEFMIPDEAVSSHHARLSYHHHQWWAEDLNSTNGTLLNNDPVTVPTVIMSGDELRVGKIAIQLITQND